MCVLPLYHQPSPAASALLFGRQGERQRGGEGRAIKSRDPAQSERSRERKQEEIKEERGKAASFCSVWTGTRRGTRGGALKGGTFEGGTLELLSVCCCVIGLVEPVRAALGSAPVLSCLMPDAQRTQAPREAARGA